MLLIIRHSEIQIAKCKDGIDPHRILSGECDSEPYAPSPDLLPPDLQFTPGAPAISGCELRGVSMTFPDGVSLTLQECVALK